MERKDVHFGGASGVVDGFGGAAGTAWFFWRSSLFGRKGFMSFLS
jgi:hypothetical protein